ncbi:helix-turn-helix transcriptional regulator [Xanthobacter autotrophicus]|uniref:helix-turn-helix domain-containing protein n=1 Tax=Xanthobacter autotrophicus TaxID=280 RepID=UPI0037264BF3
MPPVPKPSRQRHRHFIREWRKFRHLTQEQVAARVDMSRENYSRVERGLIPYSQDALEQIADALSCEPGDLLGRDPFKEGDVVDLLRLIREKDQAVVRAILSGLPSVKRA